MRTVVILGVVWFIAADVCRVLGISHPTDSIAGLDEDEKCLTTTEAFSGGGYGHNLISESGLYALILRSRKPAAVRFRKWVTAEVLPALRRDGGHRQKSRSTTWAVWDRAAA